MNNSFNHIIRFLALITVQVLVLNKVQFNGYFNPYIYILFIFLLPLKISPLVSLLLSFVLGFTVDTFSGTPGLHTSTAVLIAFIRPWWLKRMLKPEDFEIGKEPNNWNYGLSWFLIYTGFLTLIHHLALNFLEVFSFQNVGDTLLRSLVNTLISVLFMLIAMVLFSRKKDAEGISNY